MTDKIRWGILGTGSIAKLFAQGLQVLPDAELTAVGSRTQEAADHFADAYHIPRRYASYTALANDPQVDVIYIATPHNFHCENTLLCLDAGKAVLCEKPFAINAREAALMVTRAREKGLFLMEAMWTRYLPVIVRARQLIAEGAIGDVRLVTADFGFRTSVEAESRLFNIHYGGGSLMDVGIYPLALTYMLLGMPSRIQGMAHLGETGADEQAAWIFGYPDGQMAVMSSAIRTNSQQEARIAGTEGLIRIPEFWHAREMTLSVNGKPDQVIAPPFEGNGYNYEAAEVARCLRAGQLESQVMSLDESLAIMNTMDAIRAQWGLRYPADG